MGYLKSTIESTLVYAEQAKLNDYVSTIRKSFKPADSVAAQVEAVLSTHGAPLVTKIDTKLDPVVDAATEKYQMTKEKCTEKCSEMVMYAQTKKDGVVSYAQEKKEGVIMKGVSMKEGVIMKAKETKKTVTSAKEDIVRKVKSGELEQLILKKAESNAYADWVAKTVIGYKGKLMLNAKTITTQIKTKSNEQMAALMALAKQLKGKLPIAEVNAKVEKFTEYITGLSSPYITKMTPYYTKAKTDIYDAKTKVYEKFMELKMTYLAKKTN